jgi:hypothetical protein
MGEGIAGSTLKAFRRNRGGIRHFDGVIVGVHHVKRMPQGFKHGRDELVPLSK